MKKHKLNLIIGSLLILTGIVLNEWLLAYLISDGEIDSLWKKLLIWSFDIAAISSGIFIIKKVQSISWKNIALAFSSVFISFIIAELLFRAFYPVINPFDQMFGKPELFEPKPYVMFGGKPNAVGLNAMGYKEQVPEKIKTPGEFRIFILGGSTVYAGDTTFTKFLEMDFQKKGLSNVKCYNFGIPASTAGMELARIVCEMEGLQPDIIVMYNGGNDMMTPLWADPRPGYPYNYFIYENNPLLKKNVDSYPMVNLMLYESKLLRHLFPSYFIKAFTNYDQMVMDERVGKESWKKKIVDIYTENVVKAQKISNGFGIRFVQFFQPTMYFKDSLSAEEKNVEGVNKLEKYAVEMHQRIDFNLDSVKKVFALNSFDLSNMFDKQSGQIFEDDLHLTSKGNKIVADTLCERLMPFIEQAQAKP